MILVIASDALRRLPFHVPGRWCSLRGQTLPSERPCRAAGVARLWGAGRAGELS
jgi:hypothetical protein